MILPLAARMLSSTMLQHPRMVDMRDSKSDVAKDEKLAELQAQEIDQVKQSYEQHGDRFGNRG